MPSSSIELARDIAVRAHSGQTDKLGEPYIQHPATVASMVQDLPDFDRADRQFQQDAVVAAWLHDVVEDTDETRESLLRAGVSAVAVAAVIALTRADWVPADDYYRTVKADPLARLVKVADIASNLSPGRVTRLDSSTRVRLAAKYANALMRLGVDRAVVQELHRRRSERENLDQRGRSVSMFSTGGLHVKAAVWSSGGLSIEGQDLRGDGEYEYSLTVDADLVPIVSGALEGHADTDVLELLAEHGDVIVRRGEMAWLRTHGIPYEFWSRTES